MIPSRNNPPTQEEIKQQFQTAIPIEINIKIFGPLISQQNAIPIFPECYVIITSQLHYYSFNTVWFRISSLYFCAISSRSSAVLTKSSGILFSSTNFFAWSNTIDSLKVDPVIHLEPWLRGHLKSWPWDSQIYLSGSPLINKCRVNWHSCFAKRTPSSSFGGDTNNTRGKIRRNKCLIHAGNGGWLSIGSYLGTIPWDFRLSECIRLNWNIYPWNRKEWPLGDH